MLAPNHAVGGVVVTGFLSALCGENILHTKTNIFCVLFFALLPDIDNPKSPVSWLCRPLSIWTFRNYGHRTITHSLTALVCVWFVTSVLGHFTPVSAIVCGFAYFSHLLLDMMTVQGVPLMYPFSRSPYVLPDNPRYRFRTGDVKSEVMIFGVCSGLLVFLTPLFEDGFWTTYNRNFGTPKTLYSEFIKSNDLLEAVYTIQKGSAIDTGRGFVIDADNQDKFTLMRNDSLFQFDATKQIIKQVVPTHTQKKFYFENKTFIGISSDSLNKLLQNKIVMDIQADANEPFIVSENGMPNNCLLYTSPSPRD
jgi:inner membrane protein